MPRVLAATAVALFMLSGCGSTSGDGGASSGVSSAGATASPSGSSGKAGATYLSHAETDAINAAARPAQAAARRAIAAANVDRCNRLASKSFSAWRACWHGLLDPYSQKLRALATEFRILQAGSFSPPCVDALKAADATFQSYAVRVDKILAGIDSPKRDAQVRAMKGYTPTVNAIEAGYQRPFDSAANVCVSPEELKRARSSASASPSP